MSMMWIVMVTLISGVVGYWIGRRRGHLDGLHEDARLFEERLNEGMSELAVKRRDEVIREVIRTGDAHYMDDDGIVRRVERKTNGEKR